MREQLMEKHSKLVAEFQQLLETEKKVQEAKLKIIGAEAILLQLIAELEPQAGPKDGSSDLI
jgi:hypothetical protein